MVAEIALHRRLGVLALFEPGERVGERLDVVVRRGPAEVAAVVLGARVLGLLGQVLELLALLELVDDGLGVLFLVNQDVARLVFLVAVCALMVVFLLELFVGDRVGSNVSSGGRRSVRPGGQIHLAVVFRLLVEALLFRFLGQHFAADQLFADGVAQFGGWAGPGPAARQGRRRGAGDRLAVDRGEPGLSAAPAGRRRGRQPRRAVRWGSC